MGPDMETVTDHDLKLSLSVFLFLFDGSTASGIPSIKLTDLFGFVSCEKAFNVGSSRF